MQSRDEINQEIDQHIDKIVVLAVNARLAAQAHNHDYKSQLSKFSNAYLEFADQFTNNTIKFSKNKTDHINEKNRLKKQAERIFTSLSIGSLSLSTEAFQSELKRQIIEPLPTRKIMIDILHSNPSSPNSKKIKTTQTIYAFTTNKKPSENIDGINLNGYDVAYVRVINKDQKLDTLFYIDKNMKRRFEFKGKANNFTLYDSKISASTELSSKQLKHIRASRGDLRVTAGTREAIIQEIVDLAKGAFISRSDPSKYKKALANYLKKYQQVLSMFIPESSGKAINLLAEDANRFFTQEKNELHSRSLGGTNQYAIEQDRIKLLGIKIKQFIDLNVVSYYNTRSAKHKAYTFDEYFEKQINVNIDNLTRENDHLQDATLSPLNKSVQPSLKNTNALTIDQRKNTRLLQSRLLYIMRLLLTNPPANAQWFNQYIKWVTTILPQPVRKKTNSNERTLTNTSHNTPQNTHSKTNFGQNNVTTDKITLDEAKEIIRLTKKLIEQLKRQAFWMSHRDAFFWGFDKKKLKEIRALYNQLTDKIKNVESRTNLSTKDETFLYRISYNLKAITKTIYQMLSRTKNNQENDGNVKIAGEIKKHVTSYKLDKENFFHKKQTKKTYEALQAAAKINATLK
ncbi:MAG: hypothetical protein Q8R83_01605 [Legionellaceae bacterium]|nr:hypothetical protein [Legionellaceae bacterium]